MPDREKVIKWLDVCKTSHYAVGIKEDYPCRLCPYHEKEYCMKQLITDALALLKEQEDVSNALVEQCDRVRRLRKELAEQPQIVRCGECKHNYYELPDGRIVCTHIDKEGNDEHGADWFCADGERK